MKKTISLILILALWASLTAYAWFKPASAISDAERRPLEQFPELNGQSLTSGQFMKDFADYAVDQFPLRDGFRTLNAYLTYYLLGKSDNNGIYLHDGYAVKMEYPLDESSVQNAINRFTELYEMYLTDCSVRFVLVPDKGYYLAEENGYLTLDYSEMFGKVQSGMPWAEYVDITDCLSVEDYYYTDTHWRQEQILPVAQKLSSALGVTAPKAEDFTVTALERPFYGVYYGQAALPMDPETMYIMESQLLADCTVYNYSDNKTTNVYDENKLDSLDQYDIFLSGPQSMLRIENPNATTDRELIVFRDSYGSSLVPLLVQDYAVVTLVDIRTNYIMPERLGSFIEFNGQDVLFMYSSLVLNKNLI